MMDFLQGIYTYYYLIIILQGLCVLHSIRRGTQSKWLWIIVFLPLVGCIAYVFTEIIKKHHVSSVQSGVVNLVNPGGKISELEKKFKFSDTFTNRVALADAYLQNGWTEKAIELYEPSLTGMFENNEHVVKQLIESYYKVERFEDVIRIGPRIINTLDFSKSHANLLYALSLDRAGNHIEAEKQFKTMNHRYSNYEARYNYGEFLLRLNRIEDAAEIFHDIVRESESMNRKEKGNSKIWIDKAQEQWSNLTSER